MKAARTPLCLAALGLTALAVAAIPAAAHEHVDAGPYEFEFGWVNEPAVVGSPNGFYLGVLRQIDANTSEPVLNAHLNLTATLNFGTTSAVKALEPLFGEPGAYTFDLIPTREGTYAVGITGTLNGTVLNLSAEIEPPFARGDLEFPVADPTTPELEAQLAGARANSTMLAARVATLESESASLNSAAARAELLAVVGIFAGAAGAALAVMARRTPPKSG